MNSNPLCGTTSNGARQYLWPNWNLPDFQNHFAAAINALRTSIDAI
jgi:hypothetical protein